MSRLITERNTGLYGELPVSESAAKISKRYTNGLKLAQGVNIVPGEGITPSKGPGGGSFETTPRTYRCDVIRGGLHLRNTSVGLVLDNPSYPSGDSGTEGPDIVTLLNQAITAGNFYSRVDIADGPNPADFPGGRCDMIKVNKPDGTPITPAIPAGTVVSIPAAFSYYRGGRPVLGPGDDPSTNPAAARYAKMLGWAIVGSLKWTQNSTGDHADVPYLVRGTCPITDYDSDFGHGFSITEKNFSIPAGVYTVTQDVYLIGRTSMFTGTVDAAIGHSRSSLFSHETLGTPALDQFVLGYTPIVAPGAGINYNVFTTTLLTAAGDTFYFKSRTIVVGERRFGRASLYGREMYLGATTIGFGADRNTAPTDDESAYVVQLDSGPIWYQATMQGIVIGTANTEYLLGNEQIKSQRRLQTISNCGTKASSDPLFSCSAMFEGNIYFLSSYGLTTIPFSNEAQAFLPRHFKFDGYRMTGNPKSLAASHDERCLYFTFDDGTLWKIWPDSGALAGVNLQPGAVLQGVLTRPADSKVLAVMSQYVEDEYVGDYFAECDKLRTGDSVFETTNFGKDPSVIARPVKLILDVVATKGGTYEMTGEGGDGPRPIPYTPQELVSGMTGPKAFRVGGRSTRRGEGRGVRFTFKETDEFRVVAVSAESEVS